MSCVSTSFAMRRRRKPSGARVVLVLAGAQGFNEELKLCGVLFEPSDAAVLRGRCLAKALDHHLEM